MSRTDDLLRADKAHVWHPFTPMSEWCAGTPLVIERGEGNYLYDTEGRRYLDAVSSLWVTVHGHNHPTLNAAITGQLERLAHSTLLGLTNPPAAELAERLAAIAPPGLSRVFYSDSGSTAVEIALKQAFQYWKQVGRPEKRRFIHLDQAYHGDTLGAVAVGGISLFHEVFGPLLTESLSFPTPHLYRHPTATSPDQARDHSLRALEFLLANRGHEVAAVIVEPLVQGAAGMLVQPPGFLRGVADLCRQHDVLLIADEVATGFGRTGTMFACEQEDVQPDLLCLAKGITGGYLPLAATLATDRVYEGFLAPRHEGRTFFHGHTYTGNPLACAAALANLEVFAAEDTLTRLPGRIETLATALAELADHHAVGDIRQKGLMVGIELVADKRDKRPFPVEDAVAHRACLACREHGVILRNLGDVVVLMPPLSITDDELLRTVSALRRALDQVVPAR